MTVSTLRPNATTGNTGALTGGATAHAVLSDDSDASYITYNGQFSTVALPDLTLPAGAIISKVAVRARCSVAGAPISITVLALGTPTAPYSPLAGGTLVISNTAPTTITFPPGDGAPFTDANVDATTLEIATSGGGQSVVYAVYLDVTYVEKPVIVVDAPTGTITTTNMPLVSWTWQ